MAKVKVKGLEVITRIQEAVQNLGKSDTLLLEVFSFSKNRIQSFMQAGKSIVTGKKFEPLSDYTINQRKRIEKYNFTDQLYSAETSNLTFSGQLVDSIDGKIDRSKREISIGVKGTHQGMVINKFGDKSPSVPMSEVASLHQKGGSKKLGDKTVKIPARPFLGMDDTGVKRIKQIVLREIRRSLRK